MDENAQDPAGEAPEKKPATTKGGKTLNMKSLQSEVNAQNAATAERLDSLEETLAETNAGMESILDALKGMTAQNMPTQRTPNHQDAAGIIEDFEKDEVFAEFDDDLQKVVPVDRALEEIDMDHEARLAFDQEKLVVVVAPSFEEDQDPRVEIAVNGKSVIFLRGQNTKVPRYIVEGLARAKPYTYGNVEYLKENGDRAVKWPEHMGLRYPFSVLYDPNPIGPAWLDSILSQRH